MNAPAALLFAKILIPETNDVDHKLGINREEIGRNPIDALANGTTQGLSLALNVAAMLISFYALILLLNYMLSYLGLLSFGDGKDINQWLSMTTNGRFEELSLQAIFGFLFAPIAWLIGISSGEILEVGQLIGTKLFATEFFAFADLATLQSEGLSTRSVYLATFALCGFANFMSIGIQIGGIGALAPERRSELASLGIRALVGGTLASLLSATIAGLFL
jgi:CNT family concentrative nucleoside transporter